MTITRDVFGSLVAIAVEYTQVSCPRSKMNSRNASESLRKRALLQIRRTADLVDWRLLGMVACAAVAHAVPLVPTNATAISAALSVSLAAARLTPDIRCSGMIIGRCLCTAWSHSPADLLLIIPRLAERLHAGAWQQLCCG